MSNSSPTSERKILDFKLFNGATHYYTLSVPAGSRPVVESNDDSEAFNCVVSANDPTRMLAGEPIVYMGCFGNQHPEAVLRDMGRVPSWDTETLREYSMFTIGDILIVTEQNVYFSVNGDLVVTKRTEDFAIARGVK